MWLACTLLHKEMAASRAMTKFTECKEYEEARMAHNQKSKNVENRIMCSAQLLVTLNCFGSDYPLKTKKKSEGPSCGVKLNNKISYNV